jgi:uncharacterized membrane protein
MFAGRERQADPEVKFPQVTVHLSSSPSLLDRPALLLGSLISGVAAGFGLGVLAAYLAVARHVVSPDNVAAGAALGFGGVVLGTLAGLAVAVLVHQFQYPRAAR